LFSGLPEDDAKPLLKVCQQTDYFPALRSIFLGAVERLAPRLAASYYMYGLTEQAVAAGRFDKAEEYLERALQLDPKQSADITGEVSWLGYSYLAHGYIGLANRAGDVLDFDRAAIYLERALGIDPQQKAEAVGYMQLNEQGKPIYLGYIGLAWSAANAAKFEHAAKFLERALQLDPAQKSVVVGQWPRSTEPHDALSLDYGYLGLAYHATQHGQLAHAAASLERALQLDPQQKRTVIGQQRADATGPLASCGYWGLAYRALQADDKQQAVAYLLRLKQLDKRLSLTPVAQWDSDGNGYVVLARVARQLNDGEAMKKYLQQYSKLGYKREAQTLAHELGVKLGRL
jgi:tetratricopeptide (TPR) repeat protein